jgi:hypothetical protein
MLVCSDQLMRSLVLILVLSVASQEGSPVNWITLGQLGNLLATAHGESDSKVASELKGLELMERMSSSQFTNFSADLPGDRARGELLVLADKAAFVDPPASEIPSKETPDVASQRQIIALAVNYVKKTLHELPNFYATRVTTSFRRELWSNKPFHMVGRYRDTEIYQDGQRLRRSRHHSRASGLSTSGEFGPILSTAVLDAASGNLTWSHWEQGKVGPLAVFQYAVSANESHYNVQDHLCAYKGEIAIDPSSGAILRIVLKTDAAPDNSLAFANIVVEYGVVELGRKTYICPQKSVAFSESLRLRWLNDVVFENYHLFRPEMRILPGFTEVH